MGIARGSKTFVAVYRHRIETVDGISIYQGKWDPGEDQSVFADVFRHPTSGDVSVSLLVSRIGSQNTSIHVRLSELEAILTLARLYAGDLPH